MPTDHPSIDSIYLDVLRSLDRGGVRAVALRGHDPALGFGSDLDLLVDPHQLSTATQITRDCLHRAGCDLVGDCTHAGLDVVWAAWEDRPNELVEIDLATTTTWVMGQILPVDDLLAARVQRDGLWVLQPGHESLLQGLPALLGTRVARRTYGEQRRLRVAELLDQDPARVQAAWAAVVGARAASLILAATKSGELERLNLIAPWLRAQRAVRNVIVQPTRAFDRFAEVRWRRASAANCGVFSSSGGRNLTPLRHASGTTTAEDEWGRVLESIAASHPHATRGPSHSDSGALVASVPPQDLNRATIGTSRIQMNRAQVSRFLASLRLLPAADRVRLAVSLAKHRRSNLEFKKSHPDFAYPPLIDVYDAYGKLDWRRFHDSGKEVADYFANQIATYAPEATAVLEWGCGPGRLVRHLRHRLGPEIELFGTDFNTRSIAWCASHLEGINFSFNHLAPPLRYPSERFDVVYAHSVLTHLSSEMHFAWMDEIRRVIRPGGIVILTLNGDGFRESLSASQKERYDAGELITSAGEMEGKKYYGASHPPDFVRRQLLKGWEVLEHDTDHAASTMRQDIWVARKPAEGDRVISTQ